MLGVCWVQAQKVSHNADSTGSQLLKALGAKVCVCVWGGSKGCSNPPEQVHTHRLQQARLPAKAQLYTHRACCLAMHHILKPPPPPRAPTHSIFFCLPFLLHVPCFAGLISKCNAFDISPRNAPPLRLRPAKQCMCAQVLARDVLRPAVIIFTVKRSLADRGFLPSIHFARPAQLLQGTGSDGGGGRLEVCCDDSLQACESKGAPVNSSSSRRVGTAAAARQP